MDVKLTLKLDKKIIEKAKKYASSQNRSLSRIIEDYFKALVEKGSEDSADEMKISPFVQSLKTGVKVPAKLNHKKERGEYLSKKYQ